MDDTLKNGRTHLDGGAELLRQSCLRASELRGSRATLVSYFAGPGVEQYEDGECDGTVNGFQSADIFNALFGLLPLITVNPEPYVVPRRGGIDPGQATLMGETIKVIANRNELEEKFGRSALDSLFRLAVYYTYPKAKQGSGMKNPAGKVRPDLEICVDYVDPEDFIFDITARTFAQCKFVGHVQRIPRKVAAEDPRYAGKEGLINSIPQYENSDYHREEVVADKMDTRDRVSGMDPYDEIGLLHLYLPREGRVVTMPYGTYEGFTREEGESSSLFNEGEILYSADFVGPPTGPYTIIAPLKVPSTCIPISYAELLAPLFRANNVAFAKILDRIVLTKDLLVVEGSENTSQALAEAPDGSVVNFASGVAASKHVHFEGPTQQMLASHALLSEKASNVGLNLNLVGGMGLPSDTYRSNQLLANASQGKLKVFQSAQIKGAIDIFCKIGWYLLNSGVKVDVILDVEGEQLFHEWSKKQAKGAEFDDFDFSVKASVSKSFTSEDEYDKSMKLMNEVLMPLAGLGMQQGVVIDVAKVIDSMAAKLGLSRETAQWLKEGEAVENPGVATNAGSSTRNVNVSGSGGPVTQEDTQ